MNTYWKQLIAMINSVPYEGTDGEMEALEQIIALIREQDWKANGVPETPLEKAWDEIKYDLEVLKLEDYIDDQYQIGEIWRIVENLLKESSLENEPWSLKESILRELYENYWYDEFGIYDPMKNLEKAMCTTPEEKEKQAVLQKEREEKKRRRRW